MNKFLLLSAALVFGAISAHAGTCGSKSASCSDGKATATMAEKASCQSACSEMASAAVAAKDCSTSSCDKSSAAVASKDCASACGGKTASAPAVASQAPSCCSSMKAAPAVAKKDA